ncbi:hypothetical protein AVEN_74379-1 [Araneus ventricosus]|uniref:Uncharacterized protein n=1 Tax=Araneus ventricosus TaxID=182803 RepID=A0A4Y2X8V4_ARAVE|nr:hypothetical protein AVEN_102179-1 [Araneus ventricosus]GBO45628.1 hypothetical protein AVEN_74379-1 [Araneus ventricosus]
MRRFRKDILIMSSNSLCHDTFHLVRTSTRSFSQKLINVLTFNSSGSFTASSNILANPFENIVTKIVLWMYGEGSPTSWIMENDALFHKCSRKHEAQVTRNKELLYRLATQADRKSLIITEIALSTELSLFQLTNSHCEQNSKEINSFWHFGFV